MRRYLTWESIVAERDTLNLDPHQVKQAENQKAGADGAVTARLPEMYQWLLVPVQTSPEAAVTWQAARLTSQSPLAARAGKTLAAEELLFPALGGSRLRMELDRVLLWRGDHVAIRQLGEDFARYPYLPRLVEPAVVRRAIENGLELLTWEKDLFAYAESYDEAAGRYRGLRSGQRVAIMDGEAGLLVRPEAAQRQLDTEAPIEAAMAGGLAGRAPGGEAGPPGAWAEAAGAGAEPRPAPRLRRFHGSVPLDPLRIGRDAGRIADGVAHLAGLVGAKVGVTLEIEAQLPAAPPTTSSAPHREQPGAQVHQPGVRGEVGAPRRRVRRPGSRPTARRPSS